MSIEKQRLDKFKETLKSDTGTHRLMWVSKIDGETKEGDPVYTSAEEAQADADILGKKYKFIKKIWVEEVKKG